MYGALCVVNAAPTLAQDKIVQVREHMLDGALEILLDELPARLFLVATRAFLGDRQVQGLGRRRHAQCANSYSPIVAVPRMIDVNLRGLTRQYASIPADANRLLGRAVIPEDSDQYRPHQIHATFDDESGDW